MSWLDKHFPEDKPRKTGGQERENAAKARAPHAWRSQVCPITNRDDCDGTTEAQRRSCGC